jgi:pimeloyl-ACP methyl ester carboxylesterase
VPDEGETVGEIFGRLPPHARAARLQPDSDGLLWLTVDDFRKAVAPDASPDDTFLMAVTQKPIALKCLGEPMTRPAWREKPSLFLVADNDTMVSTDTQRLTATRMKSTILSLPVDHTPLASRPNAVADVISDAAASI